MKKALLLSVVASSMIMAGGDIAPVEPAVEAPAEVASWEFGGQAVLYYQTNDADGAGDLFDQDTAWANAGVQLRATNADVFAGIGAGVEVNGLATLGLHEDVVVGPMMNAGTADTRGGWISQAYLTYGMGNTTLKAGRQELPKALSPFAFSEGWNVFKNTFDAIVAINTDLPSTTLVGAWVAKANIMTGNGTAPGADQSQFVSMNPDNSGDDDGVFMITAQNKSIENVTLTGTWYYASEFLTSNDLHALWGDAKFGVAGLNIGLQAGTLMHDDFNDDFVAYGAKIGGTFGMVDASIAYTSTDDGGDAGIDTFGATNLAGIKTPLYTQAILNQGHIQRDSDTVLVKAGVKALGGKVGAYYNYSDKGNGDEYSEFAVTYKGKVTDDITVFGAYVYNDLESNSDSGNFIRVWGRYAF